MFNRVSLEINLTAIRNNLRSFQKAVYPAEIMVVVKAHGYGTFTFPAYKKHFEPVLEVYQNLGIKRFAVSNAKEAVYLKKLLTQKKIIAKILLLGSVYPQELDDLIKNKVVITLADLERYAVIYNMAKRLKTKAEVLLLVDTGMGRLGLPAHTTKKALADFLNRYEREFELANTKNTKKNQQNWVSINGMFSHLSNAHIKNDKHTLRQIRIFDELKQWVQTSYPTLTNHWEFHLANSWGGGNYRASHYDLVRVGVGQYGVEPAGMELVKVKSAVSLKSFLILKRKLPAGHSISYDCRYHLPVNTWVGTVSAGYADGIPLGMSSTMPNKKNTVVKAKYLINGWVLIRGKKYPVIGKVTMDYVMIDLGQRPKVQVGDEVVFFGKSGKQEISVADFARYKQTHGYEVLCAISPIRVARNFIK